MNRQKPSVAVITCSLRADEKLLRTLTSIYRQTNISIASIIVTPDSNIMNCGIGESSKVIIRKEDGVYDAMNAGLAVAEAEYCMFLNSGDQFMRESSVSDLFENIRNQLWGYGAIQRMYPNGKSKSYRFFPYSKFLHKYAIKYVPHPASFVHTETAKRLSGFDLRFNVSADQKMLLQFSQLSRPLIKHGLVSAFSMDGSSASRNYTQINQDFAQFRSSIFKSNTCEFLFRGKSLRLFEHIYNLKKSKDF